MVNALDFWFDSKRFSPFRELARTESSMDRLMNEMLNLKMKDSLKDFEFAPSSEIKEDETSYHMKFDLPGVAKEDVKVEVDQNHITVHAERKQEKKEESKKKHLCEIYYGSYTRSFALPGPVDEKKVEAKFENGVLLVSVAKGESHKVKTIPVH